MHIFDTVSNIKHQLPCYLCAKSSKIKEFNLVADDYLIYETLYRAAFIKDVINHGGGGSGKNRRLLFLRHNVTF